MIIEYICFQTNIVVFVGGVERPIQAKLDIDGLPTDDPNKIVRLSMLCHDGEYNLVCNHGFKFNIQYH